jgi:hypothetical protein
LIAADTEFRAVDPQNARCARAHHFEPRASAQPKFRKVTDQVGTADDRMNLPVRSRKQRRKGQNLKIFVSHRHQNQNETLYQLDLSILPDRRWRDNGMATHSTKSQHFGASAPLLSQFSDASLPCDEAVLPFKREMPVAGAL